MPVYAFAAAALFTSSLKLLCLLFFTDIFAKKLHVAIMQYENGQCDNGLHIYIEVKNCMSMFKCFCRIIESMHGWKSSSWSLKTIDDPFLENLIVWQILGI
jgi:hypothetical protein